MQLENADYDIIIVGAGISGINAAYRIQTQLPECKYAILEGREVLGGTWALFQYPGIRSDSDLFTFGFSWRPWNGATRFANGTEICEYMKEAAKEYGIDKRIKYNHKVDRLAWSTDQASWAISVKNGEKSKTIRSSFVILGTGYYDYHNPMQTIVPGLENFNGQVVLPQFWPKELDYADKKIVIIGSGATAITLLPNLAKTAAHVTMLQRSPSYVMTIPNKKKFLPQWVPYSVKFAWDYVRFLILPWLFYKFCLAFPQKGREMIRSATTKLLPPEIPHDPHFNPSYNPWEQRLCMSPDGDFFQCLREKKASVVTGKIIDMKESSIILESGEDLEADIIIQATGLKLQMAGGAEVYVDGTKINIGDQYMWRGMMVESCPNLAFVAGYVNASWTLGADCTALVVCRLITALRQRKAALVVPSTANYANLQPESAFKLSSTYITNSPGVMPKAGDVAPWKARGNYFLDYFHAKFGNITDGLVMSTGR